MANTVLSHLCLVDNMWLVAFTTTLQTMMDDLTHHLQWCPEECYPLKAFLLYRDKAWWKRHRRQRA